MFKHTHEHPHHEHVHQTPPPDEKPASAPEPQPPAAPLRDTSPAALRELLEKNLKWSQIIYEQNRRINSKLFWGAIGSWFRVILFFVVLAGSALFLSPFFKQFYELYSGFLRSNQSGNQGMSPTTSLENILKFLPLDSSQQEQLKTFLK